MDILLIPGFMLDGGLWSEMRADLMSQGRLIDADLTQDESIEDMADRAICTLQEPAIIVGFSMGGYVARAIARRAPEKTKGLALIATSSRAHAPHAIPPDVHFRRLGQSTIAHSLHPEHRTRDVMERVGEMSERLGENVFRRQSAITRADDSALLGLIRCPTLIVCAAQDQLRSIEEGQTLRDGIVGSTMHVIEQSGHLIPLEQPCALGRLLENFIANLAL